MRKTAVAAPDPEQPDRGRKFDAIPFQRARVPLGKLLVHPKVQRPFRAGWAKEIAESFDETAMDDLWVNREKGKLYVFDGQHRCAAIRQYIGDGWEFVDVPCRIYDNLDIASLARLTGRKNYQRRWTQIAEFLRAVQAQEPTAVAINAIVRQLGLRVAETSAACNVRAVRALHQVFEWKPDGPTVLKNTLLILREAWPEDVNAFHENLIKGLAHLLHKHGSAVDRDRLLRRLQGSHSPIALIGQGRAHADAIGVSKQFGMLKVLVRSYNTGLRSGKLDEH